ncbi:PssE/Cps14G family polysaccharide biosynthesis glycosyltransferase [Priestia megaterium]|uniref:PssE/Cps14G family polysaccharide biosynthesis glycosyltransferase n=1 Tax=Priestia megaterium TaxID=1404 RepID=UPI0016430036|nr:PssE/Cps14G family polysaccharide biosynthesis glycosyltransferase [Priestia megaterium]
MKVLVTIGSMVEKKFTRLFNIIDELCEQGVLDGNKVTAQVGFDNYQTKNFNTFDMMADEDFKKLINESDLIITHAGTGTVMSCLKQKKKVIIFPRMAEFDEHYDDHQLELCDLFKKDEYVLCATNKEELIKCIVHSEHFRPNVFKSNNSSMNNLIIDFIEKI